MISFELNDLLVHGNCDYLVKLIVENLDEPDPGKRVVYHVTHMNSVPTTYKVRAQEMQSGWQRIGYRINI